MAEKQKNIGYPTGKKIVDKRPQKKTQESPTWGSSYKLRKVLEELKKKLPAK